VSAQGPAKPRDRFGLFTPVFHPINRREWEDLAGPDEIAAIVCHAEKHGFAFTTTQDHGAIAADELNSYGSARFFDPFVSLGFLAACTTQIELVTHVYQVHLRSPLITAKGLATADVLSRGRLIAGFGVGSREYEARLANIDFSRRGQIADEYIEAIVALWTGVPVAFRGEIVDFDELVCAPAPVQRPRPEIWIGGNRTPGLRRALRRGDAWAPWSVTTDHVAGVIASVRDRDGMEIPDDFRIVVSLPALGGRAPRGQPAPAFEKPSDAQVQRCVDAVEGWREIGATDFVLDLPASSLDELFDAISWFADDVASEARLVRASDKPTKTIA
jgi:probable F420-dependent oxidoreductase